MNKPSIYLAGPITGLNYNGATLWRDHLDEWVGEDFHLVSPTRAKEFLATGEILDHTAKVYDNVLSSPQGVMVRDSWDVHRVDAVFVNFLGASKVSIGTVMEIAWAWKANTPIIIVSEPDNIHTHLMIQQATPFYAETLDEGINLLYALFN